MNSFIETNNHHNHQQHDINEINNKILDEHTATSNWSNDHKDIWWKLLYTLFTITAVGYLYARRKHNKKFHLIKPVPVILLGYIVLLWCSVHSQTHYLTSIFHLLIPHNPTSYAIYISIGLFLSAIGDLFLIFDRFFVHGIIFFLAAHLSFILAFTAESESLSNFFTPLVVVFLIGFNVFFVYLFLTKVIPMFIKNTPKSVAVALFFYTSVIITMCYTASIKAIQKVLNTLDDQSYSGFFSFQSSLAIYTCLGALGAVLFFISDLMILIREINALKSNQVSRFRKILGHGDVGMITYWLGQFCIALSVTSALN
eukprot:gene8513-10466_t